MRLPYGKSDFADLRRGGYAYADKTGFIAALESAEKAGSIWCSCGRAAWGRRS